MEPRDQNPEIARLYWLTRIAVFWALVILVRLLYLQVYKHEELLRVAESQQTRELEIKAPRGTIVDRNGEKLAASTPVDSLAINPRMLKEPSIAAELLSRVLEIDPDELLERIRQAQAGNRAFLWVKRKLTAQEADRLRAYKTEWMEFRQESKRVYLNGTLAANLIGSVDHQENGNAGIEKSLQKDLQGRPGSVRVLTDVRQRGIDSRIETPPQPGKTVALTIDQRLQYYCDKVLRERVEQEGGTTGTVVAMDPRNGDVLCMSSFPTFDPNEPPASEADLASRSNRAVTEPFEPGSVMKVFTVAAALETGTVRPSDPVFCHNGRFSWYGNTIHDTHAYGWLPVEGVIWHSSNIGAAEIGRRLGARTLHRFFHHVFGFGKPTGVGLPGETWGLLASPEKWSPGSVAYVSFGYEMAATSLQMARALSVIANGGMLVKPRIVLWKQREDGQREMEPAAALERVLKPETAIQMRTMLEGVVLKGTGKKARLAGYTSGGKTGTAKIFDWNKKVYSNFYNGSFIGFAPLTDPRVVVVVSVNGVRKMAGEVAAPGFREVASAALRLQGVTRDIPDAEPEVPEPVRIAEAERSPSPVEAREPLADKEEERDLWFAPRAPDFRGKTVRMVMKESLELGLKVELVGSGLARSQDPPAGAVLSAGRQVRVQFAR